MEATTLHVDDHAFLLDQDVDVAALKKAMLGAATKGPAFIEFRTTRNATIAVLVSSATPIRFEVDERPEAPDDESTESWMDLDFDFASYSTA